MRDLNSHRLPALALLAAILANGDAMAQRPVNPADLRRVDKRAEELQKAYIDQLDAVAEEYEKVGALDQARETMRRRLRVQDDETVRAKLDKLEELDFESNTKSLELDPAAGWVSTGCEVREGQEIRIEAEGTYRLMYNQQLGPDGVKTESIASDFVNGVPLGTLIGTVIPPKEGTRTRRNRREERPKPEPFAVGSSSQFAPETSGRLFLRVNTPQGTNAVGKLRITISGRFEAR